MQLHWLLQYNKHTKGGAFRTGGGFQTGKKILKEVLQRVQICANLQEKVEQGVLVEGCQVQEEGCLVQEEGFQVLVKEEGGPVQGPLDQVEEEGGPVQGLLDQVEEEGGPVQGLLDQVEEEGCPEQGLLDQVEEEGCPVQGLLDQVEEDGGSIGGGGLPGARMLGAVSGGADADSRPVS